MMMMIIIIITIIMTGMSLCIGAKGAFGA